MGGCDNREGDGCDIGRVMCVILGIVMLGSDGCGVGESHWCDIGEGDDGVMIGTASDGCGVGEGDECDVCYRTLRTGMMLVSTYRSLPTYSSWYVTTIISPYRELSTCNRSHKWFVCLSVCLSVCMYVCMYIELCLCSLLLGERNEVTE